MGKDVACLRSLSNDWIVIFKAESATCLLNGLWKSERSENFSN